MDESVRKGFCRGCLASVVALVGVAFLFLVTAGLLINGCIRASGMAVAEEELAEQLAADARAEEPERFETAWVTGSDNRLAPRVLRIRLNGVISAREASTGLFSREEGAGAPAALRRIRAAVRDRNIRGLLLEIDSPGGGVTVSDELHDAVMRFRRAATNRFVAVHMGDVCCSGGYYVAAAADRIWARPTTLTGSIGVIMNGVNAAELARKIGVSSVTIASGANKDLLNPLKDVDPEHVALLRKPVVEMYERFVGIVAKGRGMPVEKVRALADGRVFSAEEARRQGLVDALGYEEDVREGLKELAGGKAVRIVRYKEKPSLQRLFDSSLFFQNAGEVARELTTAAETLAAPRAEYRWR